MAVIFRRRDLRNVLRPPRKRPFLEPLEDRTLLTGVFPASTAVPLAFPASQMAQVSHSLSELTGMAIAGTLLRLDQVDTYPFTVDDSLGSGRLTATAIGGGPGLPGPGAVPRLTLLGPDGAVLIQSDSG